MYLYQSLLAVCGTVRTTTDKTSPRRHSCSMKKSSKIRILENNDNLRSKHPTFFVSAREKQNAPLAPDYFPRLWKNHAKHCVVLR